MTKPQFTPSKTVTVEPGEPIPTTNDTHVELASGRHRLTSDISPGSLRNYKLTGQGADTIIETNGNHQHLLFARFVDGPIEVGNFVIDYGPEENTAGAGFNLIVSDGLYMHDIRWEGFTPREGAGDDWKCMVRINDPNGHGYIERVESVGPSHIAGHRDGKGMGICNDEHKGTLHFRDVYIENCPGDAPWYTSGLGRCIFERMYMVNNAMANLRLGGNSEIYDSVLVQDHGREPDNTGSYDAANAILMAGQLGSHTGAHIENVDIVHTNVTGGGVPFRTHQTTGDVSVKDVRVRIDSGQNALFKENWYGQHKYTPPDDMSWHFENLSVTGNKSLGAVFEIESVRTGSTLSNSCISCSYNDLATSGGALSITNLTNSSCAEAQEHDPRIAKPFGGEPTSDQNRQEGGSETTMKTIEINATGTEQTWYHLQCDDNVDPGTAANLNDPSVDPFADKQLSSTEVVGCIAPGGRDTWQTNGSIVATAIVGGSGDITIDGQTVDADTITEPHVPADLSVGWDSGVKEYTQEETTDGSTQEGGETTASIPAANLTDKEVAVIKRVVSGLLE